MKRSAPPPASPSASHSNSPSASASAFPAPVDVRFDDISYQIPAANKRSSPTNILHHISGYVAPGESLAILGPSGSGKTTFLNLLAARSEHPPSSGSILFSGAPRVPRTKRHVGYVMQDDVFLSELTVRETLDFTAHVRLPASLSCQQRRRRVDRVIHQLRLSKCQHTRIGDQQFDKGISGGERKRVNIANELLHSPSLFLADECTSGLDSSSALTVINLLRELCDEGRTVIATIHQPSSRMFAQFSKVMLLASGRVAYFGTPQQLVPYFESIGFPFPSTAYNPADYALELIIGDGDDSGDDSDDGNADGTHPSPRPVCSSRGDNGQDDSASERMEKGERTNRAENSVRARVIAAWRPHPIPSFPKSESEPDAPDTSTSDTGSAGTSMSAPPYPTVESSGVASQLSSSTNESTSATAAAPPVVTSFPSNGRDGGGASAAPTPTPQHGEKMPPTTQLGRMRRATSKRVYDLTGRHGADGSDDKYATPWLMQVRALGRRAMLQKRGALLKTVNILQLALVIIIMTSAWFQLPAIESTIEDRLGALSFTSTFWGFVSVASAVFAFPEEKRVLAKDRAGGCYRLSAYYFAKAMVSCM